MAVSAKGSKIFGEKTQKNKKKQTSKQTKPLEMAENLGNTALF